MKSTASHHRAHDFTMQLWSRLRGLVVERLGGVCRAFAFSLLCAAASRGLAVAFAREREH